MAERYGNYTKNDQNQMASQQASGNYSYYHQQNQKLGQNRKFNGSGYNSRQQGHHYQSRGGGNPFNSTRIFTGNKQGRKQVNTGGTHDGGVGNNNDNNFLIRCDERNVAVAVTAAPAVVGQTSSSMNGQKQVVESPDKTISNTPSPQSNTTLTASNEHSFEDVTSTLTAVSSFSGTATNSGIMNDPSVIAYDTGSNVAQPAITMANYVQARPFIPAHVQATYFVHQPYNPPNQTYSILAASQSQCSIPVSEQLSAVKVVSSKSQPSQQALVPFHTNTDKPESSIQNNFVLKDTRPFGLVNFNARPSISLDGSDLPYKDPPTLRYFYNLGVVIHRKDNNIDAGDAEINRISGELANIKLTESQKMLNFGNYRGHGRNNGGGGGQFGNRRNNNGGNYVQDYSQRGAMPNRDRNWRGGRSGANFGGWNGRNNVERPKEFEMMKSPENYKRESGHAIEPVANTNGGYLMQMSSQLSQPTYEVPMEAPNVSYQYFQAAPQAFMQPPPGYNMGPFAMPLPAPAALQPVNSNVQLQPEQWNGQVPIEGPAPGEPIYYTMQPAMMPMMMPQQGPPPPGQPMGFVYYPATQMAAAPPQFVQQLGPPPPQFANMYNTVATQQ